MFASAISMGDRWPSDGSGAGPDDLVRESGGDVVAPAALGLAQAKRLGYDGAQLPNCHYLSRADFDSVRDRFDYAAL